MYESLLRFHWNLFLMFELPIFKNCYICQKQKWASFHWLFSICCMKRVRMHYDDVIMTRMASQITSLAIVYSTVYSGADQSKHQSSASLAFVWEIHRGPVNFPHKWPVTRKMFPFDDVIMDPALVISCVDFPFCLFYFIVVYIYIIS